MPIYLDNSSTTFPKPPAVVEAIARYLTDCGVNVSRGGYRAAYAAEDLVFSTRERLAALFRAPDCKCVCFTKNVTESLNVLLKGFLRPGDHVLVSSMEHNAVMRPLRQLEAQGVSFSRVPCRSDGTLIFEAMAGLLQPNTRLVVMSHASNVCGTLLPIAAVGAFCQEHGLRFFVDSAQTAGVFPIDMEAMHIDALAFTGHKGLLGPQGIGGFALREDLAAELTPLIAGGTGSMSASLEMPPTLPDRYEAGTPNLPGIMGLGAALRYLLEVGPDALHKREMALTDRFLTGLRGNEHIRVPGPADARGRVGVISVDFLRQDNAEVAFQLEEQYGILTRCGLHCAPLAHKTLGTYPEGTVRFSVGYATTEEEVDAAIRAIHDLA